MNLAIQDAVVAANLLCEPLLQGRLLPKHLAAVQRKREVPIRIMQWNQQRIQTRIQKNTGQSDQPSQVPLMGRLIRKVPFVRDLPAIITGYGVFPPRLKVAKRIF